MLLKVIGVQARMGRPLIQPEMMYIFKQRPDFVCLPEYWLLDRTVPDFARAALRSAEYLDYIGHLSEQLETCLIGGSIVRADGDRLLNSCPVFDRGRFLGFYDKIHPVPNERAHGISPGSEDFSFELNGVRVGIMICGDVFYHDRYEALFGQNVDLVFVPTTSPFLSGDSRLAKQIRDRRYFLSGAQTTFAYVIKVCGVGQLFGKPLQGRSLAAAPWGYLDQTDIQREDEARIMTLTLDIDELREFRARAKSPRRKGE